MVDSVFPEQRLKFCPIVFATTIGSNRSNRSIRETPTHELNELLRFGVHVRLVSNKVDPYRFGMLVKEGKRVVRIIERCSIEDVEPH